MSKPHLKELAYEFASALDDINHLSIYLFLVYKYAEPYLREKLLLVLSTPERKIKRSRGAYFTYLVQNSSMQSNTRN